MTDSVAEVQGAADWIQRWTEHGGSLTLWDAGVVWFVANDLHEDDPVALDLVEEACGDENLLRAITTWVSTGKTGA